MTVYVTNLCTNPSFEVDLTGYSALTGTALAQDNTYALYGQSSMLVTTDGSVAGEGFTGPSIAIATSNTTGALSLNLYPLSAATLNIEAVSSNGTVLASTLTTLTPGVWQRIVLQDFAIPTDSNFGLLVTTNTPEALSFWADAVQYETGVTVASAYIDGDQPGCAWVGTAGESASELLYQNAISATGQVSLAGDAAPVDYGEQFATSAKGKITLSGDANPSAGSPAAAFADFALFELTDPDPAMTYVDQNNQGTNSGTGSTYAQSYGLFYPPLDYPVSNGNYAWRRAAFMGVGFYFTGVPAGQEQDVTEVQVSLSPLGSTPTPAAFTPPRQIVPIIKPTRLNFCTNPSFEVSTSGWSGIGTGSVARDSTTLPTPSYNTLLAAGNLASYFNNTGITDDGDTGYGPFDGGAASYSAQQLALAGAGAGATVLSGGVQYVMPSVAADQADNIMCLGQTVTLSAAPGASVIGFLGSAASGGVTGASGTVTINYSDGTTSTATLGLSDWTLGGATQTGPSFGNQVAAQTPYRNLISGTQQENTSAYLFSDLIACNSSKQVVSITLPNNNHLHIFAISLAETSGNTFGNYSGKVTVNANGDGIEISVPDLIVGDTYTVSYFTQAAAGLSAISTTIGGGTIIAGPQSLNNSTTETGGVPYGGEPGVGYGEGFYGGLPSSSAASNVNTGLWYQPWVTFTATSSTATLEITATTGTGFSSPSYFWVDAVLIEAGEIVGSYFDGSFGSSGYLDYQWESGGTAGLCRSYYYEQLSVKQYSIEQILSQHIPVGLEAASPQYLVPYTQ